jgi:hypothetical protein
MESAQDSQIYPHDAELERIEWDNPREKRKPPKLVDLEEVVPYGCAMYPGFCYVSGVKEVRTN